ncbi:urease accessory protein UreE [Methyloglobulus morosus KoM1]|uniref:Urease accessory protein UreE n=1 Tax=Methyloglobulus morosus KoM1 TaxID=1116472 RepID=V5C1X9_9GAMM|nr:urease accessory protein UreE [Methyloglobulus morosus]ESS70813.1 urease accessory protein UreE [Methyloglobulus morosus KoM1]
MLKLTELVADSTTSDDVVTLPYETRQKSRLLSQTDSGTKIGIFLPRGQMLSHGLVLKGHDDYRVRVNAAAELLSVVRTDNPLQFARACYHLGNRHIALQILPNELRFLADHVLDQMLAGLGLTVTHESLPFEPEQGAYHGHGH